MARIKKEERKRRESAYRVWADNDFDYAAAAVAAAVDEKELHRWATVHRWHARWWAEKQEELAVLQRVADEAERLGALLDGVGADGQRLFVPVEIKLDAAFRIIDICREQRGELAESTIAMLRGMAPDAIDDVARIACGVDRGGQPIPTDSEIRATARKQLVDSGLVTEIELMALPLSKLLALLRARLREWGFEAEPLA